MTHEEFKAANDLANAIRALLAETTKDGTWQEEARKALATWDLGLATWDFSLAILMPSDATR